VDTRTSLTRLEATSLDPINVRDGIANVCDRLSLAGA
jgi:hypothetical protein